MYQKALEVSDLLLKRRHDLNEITTFEHKGQDANNDTKGG